MDDVARRPYAAAATPTRRSVSEGAFQRLQPALQRLVRAIQPLLAECLRQDRAPLVDRLRALLLRDVAADAGARLRAGTTQRSHEGDGVPPRAVMISTCRRFAAGGAAASSGR